MTDAGPVQIEHLAVGDKVLTHANGFKPIKWIGHTPHHKADGKSWSQKVEPICIRRSAISDSVPVRDLYVSPAHAIFINGCLISAKQLVNNVTIIQETPCETNTIDYFHIAFDKHEVISAEGVLAESFQAQNQKEVFSDRPGFSAPYPKGETVMDSYAPMFRYRQPQDVLFGGLRRIIYYIGLDVRTQVQIAHDTLLRRARRISQIGPLGALSPVVDA